MSLVEVVLENLTKKFGKVTAADDISLKIHDKQFFMLLGPSGGGKSTVLNMIAGLEKPDKGHIYFDGTMMDEIPPEKRDVAMVFQSYALYPHMDVLGNISIGLKVRKIPDNEITRRVKSVAEMMQISELLRRKPYQLSGGQRQRVALARAVVREPKVFLLDEPMSNVDAKLRVLMRAELIRLQKTLQTTAIYVTHDQVEAMTMGDEVAVLNNGKVIQVGTPMEVFRQPTNLFVAGFIGSPPMNFVDCTLKETGGRTLLDAPSFSLTLPRNLADTMKKETTDLILGFRPKDVNVGKEKGIEESIGSEVYAVEELGDEMIVDLKVGGTLCRAVTPPTFGAHMGDKVWMNIDMDRMHLFDKKTGECVL
jgi:multiple sugar transport system ATP-binding protein